MLFFEFFDVAIDFIRLVCRHFFDSEAIVVDVLRLDGHVYPNRQVLLSNPSDNLGPF